MTNPLRSPDSEVERVQMLVLEEVDTLLRCPAERKEAATHEALSKLEPHLKGALEALERIGQARGLTKEEFAWRGAFMMLLDVARQPG